MRFADLAQAASLHAQWHALCLVQRALASYPASSRVHIEPDNFPGIALPAAAIRELAIAEMACVGQCLREMGSTGVPAAQTMADEADHAAKETLG